MAERSGKAVANWIYIGIAMLIILVLLGGITRLTGSGLSITEWKPIMGAMPPLNETDWQKAFYQYQQIAQYKYLNQHFTLADFKFIFFWEWFHRLWARLIGVVFLIPFIFFLIKGYFKKNMIVPLVVLFLLGALQGAIGWIMVQSGLNDNDLYVSHIRLAAHFMAAMVLIAYALVFALKLSIRPHQKILSRTLSLWAGTILIPIAIQLGFGAFMAGLKAATVAPTWPDINGALVPNGLFSDQGFFHSTFYNKITIHFIHRSLAYVLAVIIGIWWYVSLREKNSRVFNFFKHGALVLVLCQVILGIATVINGDNIQSGRFGVFEWMALLHQLTGMLLMLNFVAIVYLTTRFSVPVSSYDIGESLE